MLVTDNMICVAVAGFYIGFLEAEAGETDAVEYLPQLGDMAEVVDGRGQLDEAKMAFTFVHLGGAAGVTAADL